MPELPEVEHIARYLRGRLVGATIAAVPHLDWPKGLPGTTPRAFRRAIAGATITAVERRAKLVLVRLGDGRTLAFHLTMTGKLWVAARPRPPEPFTRAIFALDRGRELRFEDQRKFGWIRLLSPEEADRIVAAYGPDALLAPSRALAEAYAARRGRAKATVLDQAVVAGIGNIYADEILFEARIHPSTRLATLSRVAFRRLADATRAVMAAALRRRAGTDVPDQQRVGAGRRGVARRLGPKVYQRTGEPCLRCGAKIARIVLAGRATHFCPRCQAPRPRSPSASPCVRRAPRRVADGA